MMSSVLNSDCDWLNMLRLALISSCMKLWRLAGTSQSRPDHSSQWAKKSEQDIDNFPAQESHHWDQIRSATVRHILIRGYRNSLLSINPIEGFIKDPNCAIEGGESVFTWTQATLSTGVHWITAAGWVGNHILRFGFILGQVWFHIGPDLLRLWTTTLQIVHFCLLTSVEFEHVS